MTNQIKNCCGECGVAANVLTCLKKYGQPPTQLKFSCSTYHKGGCDYCKQVKQVTEVRDFFHPDFTLLVEAEAKFKNKDSEDLFENSSLEGDLQMDEKGI